MKLYFLRHGLAGQYGDPKHKDDSLRPLTALGKEKMRRAVLGMKSLGLKFDAILSSPYVRARQTAEIAAKAYKHKTSAIHITNNLLAPACVKELLQETHQHFPKSGNILFVGHEPHLTEMISSLLKNKSRLAICLKKGGLCHLVLDGASINAPASLIWLLTQKQLNSLDPDL